MNSLVSYSPWGCKESDTSEHAHTDSHTVSLVKYIVKDKQSQTLVKVKRTNFDLLHTITTRKRVQHEPSSALTGREVTGENEGGGRGKGRGLSKTQGIEKLQRAGQCKCQLKQLCLLLAII